MTTQFLGPEEQENLFKLILRKLPTIRDDSQVKELVIQGLHLMLRRPEDLPLQEKLIGCAVMLFKAPAHSVSEPQKRRMIRDCIEILQAAKEHRMPRDIVYLVRPQKVHPAVAPIKSHTYTRLRLAVIAASMVLCLLGGIGVWLKGKTTETIFAEAKNFTDQMIHLSNGTPFDSLPSRWSFKSENTEGHLIIIAENVPASICAASGWELMKKGRITINNITPKRVSSAKITELCYEMDGLATITWEPKT